MTIRRWIQILLVSSLPVVVAGCGIWEPGEVEKEGDLETEGSGLFTGKSGGLVIYQK